jgi:hypothetical protein
MKSVITLLLSFCFLLTNAQIDWKKYEGKVPDGIEVEYSITACQNKDSQVEYYLIRYSNTSNISKSFTVTVKQYNDAGCINCGNNEYDKPLQLAAGASIEGNCNERNVIARIFKRSLTHSRIGETKNFEIVFN